MMNRAALLGGLVLLGGALGCSGNDAGDVDKAKAASAAAPKSVEELPADMPEAAKRQAAAAIEQSNAMKAMGDAQAEAMRKARGNR